MLFCTVPVIPVPHYSVVKLFPSRIPDPNCFKALGNMIRVVHPGSRIRILIFLPITDLGSRGQNGTGSGIPDPDPQYCCIIISVW
jgi:hypothetical protein